MTVDRSMRSSSRCEELPRPALRYRSAAADHRLRGPAKPHSPIPARGIPDSMVERTVNFAAFAVATDGCVQPPAANNTSAPSIVALIILTAAIQATAAPDSCTFRTTCCHAFRRATVPWYTTTRMWNATITATAYADSVHDGNDRAQPDSNRRTATVMGLRENSYRPLTTRSCGGRHGASVPRPAT